jgi:hypothetical protein
MTTICCSHCAMFRPFKESELGSCVRFPPVPNASFDSNRSEWSVLTQWPEVNHDDFCGEWLKMPRRVIKPERKTN